MAENNFQETVSSLFKGMDSFISAKTVVGDAVTVKDTIILPLVDVSFGVGAGAFAGDKKNNAGGAMTGKISPSAVLVIQNGSTKLVNIKNQDTVTKILDMVPDVVDKITSKFGGSDETDEEVNEAIDGVAREYNNQ
ncbi:MAG: GerW family sporulation protein [Lachnospira sp.]|nr:GerW family sporulation protein [Clostridia bacterium]